MNTKIYILTLAAFVMGCASTSSLTSDAENANNTEKESKRDPAQETHHQKSYSYGDYSYPSQPQMLPLPQEIAVAYQYNDGGTRTSKILATLETSHIKQAFLGHIHEIEDINDIYIEGSPYNDDHHRIEFKAQFSDTVPSKADNNFTCRVRTRYESPTNQVHLSFYACRSSNVSFKSGKHNIPGKSLSVPIKIIKFDTPEVFVIE